MNNRVLVSVAVALIVIGGLSMLLSRKVAKQADDVPTPSTFVVQEGRKLDFGLKYKVNDCLSEGGAEWLVVDVDDDTTYVLAPARRFYMGPHPLLDEDLRKVAATELDAKESSKQSCGDLELRYRAEQPAAQ